MKRTKWEESYIKTIIVVPDRDEGAKRNSGCVFFERGFEKKDTRYIKKTQA